MKQLIYVPIIHMKADLGSLGEQVKQKGIQQLGNAVWEEHIETVGKFWASIAKHFENLKVEGWKIYQDGLVADGEIGQKIVEESAARGSENYRIVLQLINQGAVLIKTEEIKLVKAERNGLLKIVQAESATQRIMAAADYKMHKESLLRQRDLFISQRIQETLLQGEHGILFLGAYHNILDKLPDDISIVELKKVANVREYQKLLPFSKIYNQRFEALKAYLIEPIQLPS